MTSYRNIEMTTKKRSDGAVLKRKLSASSDECKEFFEDLSKIISNSVEDGVPKTVVYGTLLQMYVALLKASGVPLSKVIRVTKESVSRQYMGDYRIMDKGQLKREVLG